ncbi:MAG: glycosyltransferase family 39 protein [Opitutaceae bacterium]|nr:glycosyltransferase family 39 protein [Opitutaceae bacterium]
MEPSRAFLTTLAVLIALLHAVLAVTATGEKSMTSDEIAHLVAGHAYNTRGDYRLQPENGNLPQRIAALPMSLAGVPQPPVTRESWRTADVWNYGHELFYRQGIVADQWLWLGRGMIALMSAATGLLIFFWSRALFGWRGAFLSLALFVFCPAFLAHGALATSDVTMTFFFVASVGAWWRHLEQPGARWAAVSAITLGLAFVAKFSAVLLPLMLAIIGLGWAAGAARAGGWGAPLRRLARTTLVHAFATWAIIWVFYGFRFSAFAPELAEGANFNHGWTWILPGMGASGTVIVALRDAHVLPEAWLYGLAFVLQFAKARGAFMSGDYSVTGWVTFFPFAFVIKTTLPLLLLLAGGAIAGGFAAARKKIAALRPLLPLAPLFAVYWATSLASNLNIGHRHILPTYPVLFIAAGWLGRWLDGRRPFMAIAIAGLTMWHAGESLRARPHYLAYFNPIVGGSENGWRHLVDSSLDWGQDLPGLKRWLDANARGERVFLSYFGTGDPGHEGIRATQLPTLPDVGPPRRWHALAPGIYAISATMLQHVYSKVRGDWTLELEKEYQQLRATEPDLLAFQNDPAHRAALLRDVPAENWSIAWKRYEQLRFARLCHYLRVRAADAAIGHSIRIYRLNAAEIEGATGPSLDAWRQLIERTVTRAEPTAPAASPR